MRARWKDLVLDRHGDLRLGWRIVLFMCLVLLLAGAGILLLRLTGRGGALPERLILLLAASGATGILTRTVNRKPVRAVGLWLHERTLRDLGMGVLLGFLMMTGIYVVEWALGYVTSHPGPGEPLAVTARALLSFGAGASAEELLFRGYPFQTLIQAVTFLPATLLMSAVFALAHLQNPHVTIISLANVVLAGVLFSFAYMKTRSLWLPLGIHAAWNFTGTTLLGFPTSGMFDEGCALVSTAQKAPVWIGGGEFGPEGGVLATIALVVCTWYILKAPFIAAPEGIVTLDSIEDLIPRNGGKAGP